MLENNLDKFKVIFFYDKEDQTKREFLKLKEIVNEIKEDSVLQFDIYLYEDEIP